LPPPQLPVIASITLLTSATCPHSPVLLYSSLYRFAWEILLKAQEVLKALPSVVDVEVQEGRHITGEWSSFFSFCSCSCLTVEDFRRVKNRDSEKERTEDPLWWTSRCKRGGSYYR
jgi:hypothetical protein